MPFLSKGRSLAVATEVTYAAATPTFIDADYVDYTAGDITTDIAVIERNVVRNSMLKLETVLGQETNSGSISVEVSAAITGAVNGDKLYTNGIGKKFAQATATTVAATPAPTASAITVTSATGLFLGQTVSVVVGTGTEFAQIASISGLNITVVPALSAAPAAAAAIQGRLTYVLPKPNDTVPSLAVRENLKPTSGSNIDYEYLGVVVSDVSLDYPVSGIVTAAFSLAGAGFTINNTGTNPVLPCAIATPMVGKNAIVKIGSTNYTAQDLSIKIGTDITDIAAITTDGLTNKFGVGKTVTGSFKVEYVGGGNLTTLRAGTKAALSLLLRDGGKTSPISHGVIAPNIKFDKVTRSEDGMVMYDTIEFSILSPDCGTVERALSVFFV